MNINLLNYDQHPQTQNFLDTLLDHGMLPLITLPTRITPTSSSLIDYITTSLKNDSFDSGINFSAISDHLAIFHIRPIQMKISKSTTTINMRKMNKRNTDRFKESISNTDWIPIYSDNPSSAFIEFYCILMLKLRNIFLRYPAKSGKI